MISAPQHIWRRWKRATGFRQAGDQQQFWRVLDPALSGISVALIASLLMLPLELTWWGVEWDLWGVLPIVRHSGPALATAFVGVWLISAMGLGGKLGRRFTSFDRCSPLRRFLTCWLVGFPLFGFHLLTLTGRRLAGAPEPVGSRDRTQLDSIEDLAEGSRAHLASFLEPVVHRLRAAGRRVLPWYVASIAVLGWAVLWLAAQRGPGVPAALLIAAGCLHGLAFAARWSGGVETPIFSTRQRWETRIHRVATWLYLLPHPGPVLALVVFLSDPTVERARSRSVLRAAFRPGTEVRRLPRWRSLSKVVSSRWQESRWSRRWSHPAGESGSRDTTLSSQRLGLLYRLATLLTLFDAVLLGHAVHEMARGRSGSATVFQGLTTAIVWGGLGVAILGGVVHFGCHAAVLLRLPARFRAQGLPFGAKYLALTCGALVLGFSVGLDLAAGDLRGAGVWLAMSLSMCLAFSAVGILSRAIYLDLPATERVLDPTFRLVWIFGPLGLAAAGVVLVAGGAPAEGVASGLRLAASLSPISHAVLAFTLGRWLLRPLTLRDLVSRELSPGRRWVLGLLAATLALPLGGLAVPGWIGLRGRLGSRALEPSEVAPSRG